MRNCTCLLSTLVIAAVMLTSCLGDDDDATLYDDVAITDFYLTYAEVTITTEASDGSDSTYTDEYDDIDDYIFRIDQVNNLIYNPDSLPINVDASRLLVTWATKNNAYVLIENIMGDSIKYLSTTDTLDFRVARYVKCYSSSFNYYKRYQINVNVRQEEEGQLKWTQYESNPTIASFYDIRAMRTSEKLIAIGYNGTVTKILTTDLTDGNTWTAATTTFDSNVCDNIAMVDDKLYVLDGTTLKVSEDVGDSFTDVTEPDNITRLIGASTTELYGVDEDCRMVVSTDGGYTWVTDSVGTDEEDYLMIQPTNGVAFNSSAYTQNDETDYVVIAINDQEGDTLTHCWRKIVMYGSDKEDGKWVTLGVDDTNHNRLKQLESLSIFKYNGSLFATGLEEEVLDDDEDDDDEDSDEEEDEDGLVPGIYESRDGGITWKTSDLLSVDEDMDTSLRAIAGTSDGIGHAWFFCAGTGEVWRGYINNAEDAE